MATLGKIRLIPQEGKKRNDLFFMLLVIMFFFLLIIGMGVMIAFQDLNKNIMNNHIEVENLQKQMEVYQEAQFKARLMLNEDFDALSKQFKMMHQEFEEMKGIYGKERMLFSEGASYNEKIIEQIKEGIFVLSLGIKNQRDELKILNENIIENLRKEFTDDFAKIIMFQNETKKELSNLMYRLSNQTQEAIGNLTKYYSEEQHYNNYLIMAMKNFLSFNDSTQDYNNTLNFSDIYSSNNTIERFYEVNNSTLSQRQNSTYNESNEAFPIALSHSREIQVINKPECLYGEEDLVDLIYHTDTHSNKNNFFSLVLKKVGEISEFASETYNKAFEKLINSFNSESNITEEKEVKEEAIEKEEMNENNGETQLMIKGVTAVRKYIGDSLRFVEGKLNSSNLQENPPIESNITKIFRNISSNIELLTQNEVSKSFENAIKYWEEMNMILGKINMMLVEIKKMKRELEQGKQLFMSLEHMFNYLDYLFEKYLDNAEGSGNASLIRKWSDGYRKSREIYEAIRSALIEEENQLSSRKMSQKKFMRKINKFSRNFYHVNSFPGI